MSPPDRAALDSLIEEICDTWEAGYEETQPFSRADYLRRRLAEHGVQMVAMPDCGTILRSMVELSPYYTEAT